MEKFNLIINELDNSRKPLFYFFVNFFFFLLLRNFWELYSDDACFTWSCFSHFDISFIWLWTAFIILFHIFTKSPIANSCRLVTVGFSIILLPPLLDLLISGGNGSNMTYLIPGYHKDIWLRYLTFWGPMENGGATLGIRTEVFLVMLGTFYYAKSYKKLKTPRSLILTLSSYTLIFLFGMSPFFLKEFFAIFGLPMNHHPSLLRNLFLLGIFLNLIIIFFFYDRKLLGEFSKKLGYLRIFHYQLIFLMGASLAIEQKKKLFFVDHFSIFNWIFISISIFLSYLFSRITFNSSTNIDLHRRSEYINISWISLAMALSFSLSVNFQISFFLLTFIGGHFIYSSYPLYLKRIPILSKLVLGFNSLIVFYMGFFFISGRTNVPLHSISFFLLGLTLLLNFIDIKDFARDKDHGVITLPVILGLEKSKKLIGLFFIIIIPLSFFWFNEFSSFHYTLIIPLILLSVLEYSFLTKKNYQETPVFWTYQIFLLGFLIYLRIK